MANDYSHAIHTQPPSPRMVVAHRSPPPPPPQDLSPPDASPVSKVGSEAGTPSPAHMQSVFSSHTGEAYRSQQHSAQVWDSHKEEIRRLYLDENKPLKEVMATMRQRGFRATVRMYKSRFDKWGFSKNNSKREVITMLQVQRQRNAVGKRTAFTRNGREVAIDAYLRRKGISQYDLAEPGIAENLPTHLRCVTPPPESPQLIQPGGTLSLQELVLQCARDLAWNPYCPPDFPLVTSAAVYRGDQLRFSITDLTNADWLFHIGQYERGGAMCEQGFKSLHLMVQRPSIYGLVHLLIFHLDAYNRGIVKEVWRYLAAYTATIRSDGPLARLFQGIFKFMSTHEYEEYWDFIFECTEKLLLVDEQQSGLPEGTVARLYPLIFIPRAYQYQEQPYRRLQSRCDFARLRKGSTPRGPDEVTVFTAMELLITGQQTRWQGENILNMANIVLEKTKGVAYNVDFFIYIALHSIAQFYRSHFDKDDPSTFQAHELSIIWLEKAVSLVEGKWDADMGCIIGDMELLEKWHCEAGDMMQAVTVRARWHTALEAIPKSWSRGQQGISA
ncbi:hypothetical protein F4778DRAFT_25133 [Xylariomycetidae sp. FL2044]|nr:hypothetical protein F4778DRAFT_25133 [Xylariomycetidae sp. FL2044]